MRAGAHSRVICRCLCVLLCAYPGTAIDAAAQDRYAPLVEGILTAWHTADVVCLGEDHARKKDSDLRLALVQHPKFASVVDAIVVEFANGAHQAVLDRFILEGATMSHDELAVVWRDTNTEVWESPVYEDFLRGVRDVNLKLPRADRTRVIAGDTAIDWKSITSAEQLVPLLKAGLQNRGGNIRKIIAEQVLEKKIKALAIYGSLHCVNVGMGFPGELADKYLGRIWSAYGFFGEKGARKGKEVFGLGDQPAYVVVKGTKWQSTPAGEMFPFRPNLTVGDMLDAVVWYGDTTDVVVPGDTTELKAKYGAELERRRRILAEAVKLQKR